MSLSDIIGAGKMTLDAASAVAGLSNTGDQIEALKNYDADFATWLKLGLNKVSQANTLLKTGQSIQSLYNAFLDGSSALEVFSNLGVTATEGVTGISGLGSFGATAGKVLPWLGLGLKAYDAMKTGDPSSIVQTVGMGAVGGGVLATGGSLGAAGSAMGVAALPYAAVGLAQMIGQAHNKPSRSYFNAYHSSDLGDGKFLVIGGIRGKYAPQSGNQDIDIANSMFKEGERQGAYVLDKNTNQIYEIPLNQLVPNEFKDYEGFEQDQYAWGDPGHGKKFYRDESGTKEHGGGWYLKEGVTVADLEQGASAAMAAGSLNPISLSKFKDTLVLADSGKDPVTLESLQEAFQVSADNSGWNFQPNSEGDTMATYYRDDLVAAEFTDAQINILAASPNTTILDGTAPSSAKRYTQADVDALGPILEPSQEPEGYYDWDGNWQDGRYEVQSGSINPLGGMMSPEEFLASIISEVDNGDGTTTVTFGDPANPETMTHRNDLTPQERFTEIARTLSGSAQLLTGDLPANTIDITPATEGTSLATINKTQDLNNNGIPDYLEDARTQMELLFGIEPGSLSSHADAIRGGVGSLTNAYDATQAAYAPTNVISSHGLSLIPKGQHEAASHNQLAAQDYLNSLLKVSNPYDAIDKLTAVQEIANQDYQLKKLLLGDTTLNQMERDRLLAELAKEGLQYQYDNQPDSWKGGGDLSPLQTAAGWSTLAGGLTLGGSNSIANQLIGLGSRGIDAIVNSDWWDGTTVDYDSFGELFGSGPGAVDYNTMNDYLNDGFQI